LFPLKSLKKIRGKFGKIPLKRCPRVFTSFIGQTKREFKEEDLFREHEKIGLNKEF